jgi:hypothetical protein
MLSRAIAFYNYPFVHVLFLETPTAAGVWTYGAAHPKEHAQYRSLGTESTATYTALKNSATDSERSNRHARGIGKPKSCAARFECEMLFQAGASGTPPKHCTSFVSARLRIIDDLPETARQKMLVKFAAPAAAFYRNEVGQEASSASPLPPIPAAVKGVKGVVDEQKPERVSLSVD